MLPAALSRTGTFGARTAMLPMMAYAALITGSYVAAARAGFQLAFVAEQVTTVWAPTGIAIAALLLGGLRFWPAVWVGAALANSFTAAPLWTAVVIASGNTLEAVAAAWLLQRVPNFDVSFRRLRDVLAFVFIAAAVCTAISATVGVSTLAIAAVQPWDRFPVLWLDWWIGDALGAIIVAPAILTVASERWSRRLVMQATALVTVAAAVTYLAFDVLSLPGAHPPEFVAFPVMIVAAIVAGPTVTTLVVLATAAAAVVTTVDGIGTSGTADLHARLVMLQVFIGILGVTALLLAAAVAEGRSAERHAEETSHVLRDREEMLRRAQRAGGVAAFEWDFRNQVATCSAEFFRIFGLPAVDGVMTGATWGTFVHPDDRERMATHLTRALAGSEPAVADYRIQRTDGSVRWLSYAGEVQRTTSGDRMLGTVVDITDRKRLEDKLRQEVEVRRALAQVGTTLAGELHSDTLVQAVTDAATRLTEAQFGAFFYNVTDEKGDSYSLYSLAGASRDAFAKFPHPRATAIFGPTFRGEALIRLDDVTQDARYGRSAPYFGMPAGHLPVRSYLAVPVLGRGNIVLGGLFFGHSEPGVFSARHEELAAGVAAWAAVALENARLYQDAEKANRLKDEFLATLSHELRTPLNAVLGWAHLLREHATDAAIQQQGAEAIERNARAQAQLVDDLLDVSRIVAGKLQIKSEPVDLHVVIENAVETVRAGAAAKGLHLHVDFPADRSIVVLGDADRLQQVVWNLVSNAIKFTPSGGSIAVRMRRSGAQAEIAVRDSGQGIDPSFKPFLFERFRQMEGPLGHQQRGLGLGLSIVRHLVEAHGGTVAAESDGHGTGSTFTVTLPLAPAAPAPEIGAKASHAT
jgi:PAS domain S-box-containing protein